MGTLVTITDFAISRGEDRDTVNAFIRKHPEIKQHVSKQGKNTVIDMDSEGYRLLEKQYPLPQMVQVIQDEELQARVVELQEQLLKSQQLIITLQNKVAESQGVIAEKEAVQFLLEDREAQLAQIKEECDAEREKRGAAEQEAAVLRNEINSFRKTIFGLYRKE